MTAPASLGDAYTAVAEAWTQGPTRIYDHLAEVLVAASPVSLRGALVLDAGAGAGAGSRAATAAGGHVLAVDLAPGMLQVDRASRPPAAVGDLLALPFAAGTFDVVLAPFSVNHLTDPSRGIAEAARVSRPGGVLLASTYAADDDHPAKAAVETALGELGWVTPDWYVEVKASMGSWGTVERAGAAVRRGGMTPLLVEHREVALPELTATDLIAWRTGMAHTAPFVASLDASQRDAFVHRAGELLGDHPATLVRRVLLIAAACPVR